MEFLLRCLKLKNSSKYKTTRYYIYYIVYAY